jgi:hypothetical protein
LRGLLDEGVRRARGPILELIRAARCETLVRGASAEEDPMVHLSRLSRLAAGILAISTGGLAGCYATAEPPAVGYADTTSAPVDIETYPSVVYEGQPVYFYGDHWWHRDGARWSYYRDEPAELHRQRDVVIHAPRRARPVVRRAPEVVHEERR